MDALIEWGYQLILALQSVRSPLLDALVTMITRLGDEEFYLLLLPFLYWQVNKRLGTRFAIMLLLSAYLNAGAKALVNQPRPSATRVAVLDDPAGGGLPSGHAQNGAATWGLIAHDVPRRGLRVAILLLITVIGLSRLYLGVHFPQDLAVGWLLGLGLLLLFLAVAPAAERWLSAQSLALQMALPAAITLAMILLLPIHEATTSASTLLGLSVGIPLERRFVRFRERGVSLARHALRLLLGLVVALLIWRGLKPVLAGLGEGGTVLRYGLLGLWLSAAAPALFVRLGLATAETLPSTVPEVA